MIQFTEEQGVVTLWGDLDLAVEKEVRQKFEDLLAASETELLIDLSRLDFIDSTGLRLLIFADTRARKSGKTLTIVGADHRVKKVFQITGLDQQLNFGDTPS